MEEKATIAESVLEHAKEYAKANLEILKLQAVDKGSKVASVIASYIIVIAAGLMFIIIANIGLAIWIGDLLGKLYYGFFIVAGFYALVALIIHLGHRVLIKRPVNSFMIKKYLQHNKTQTQQA